jgi:hypothetical protein
MRQFLPTLGAFVVALCCTACNQDELLQKFTTPADQATATEQIDLLRNRRFEELEAHMDPSIKAPNLRATLEKMAQALPADAPSDRKLVGAHTNINNGQRSTDLVWQYRFGDRYVLASCTFARRANQVVVLGMQVNPIAASLESSQSLTFTNKPARHYLFAAAAVLAVLLTLLALIACVLEKDLRKKWLWVIFILFGVTQTSLNWTTGAINFSVGSLLLFSCSWVAGIYSPWIISVAAPVGAVAYLVRRLLNSRRPDLSQTEDSGTGERA